LNFSNLNNFCTQIENFPEDSFKLQLLNAKTAKLYTEKFEKEKELYNLFPTLIETSETEKQKNFLRNICQSWNTGLKNFQNMKTQFHGADPYSIQHLVNIVLGISEDDRYPCSPELRSNYFILMKKTEFLVTNADSHLLKYQPGVLASKFLKEHSDVQTLTIGCGWAAQNISGICYDSKPHEHNNNSFSIELFAGIGPDLVVDMHNPDFWTAIPNDRFETIQDHTNAHFLFIGDSSTQTIQSIFRTLKPGGELRMDHYFEEKDITQLKSIGFEVIAETKAKKPL
jgi:hypothetical protein